MADIFDQASDREMADREASIKEALRKVKAATLSATGQCHNCLEPLPSGGLFCDRDCSADHEQRMRLRRY